MKPPPLAANTVLAGIGGPEHVGEHLRLAAQELGVRLSFQDIRASYSDSSIRRRIDWWLRGRRPSHLKRFGAGIVDTCEKDSFTSLLTTGIAPVDAATLRALGRLGVKRMNFLTDDPWNPAHRAPWFMDALPHYDCVFSPRTANVHDLRKLGCRKVLYLPFAYSRYAHFPENPVSSQEHEQLQSDVIFAGGADADRLPWVTALIERNWKVALYGGYWEKHSVTRPYARGFADPATLRRVMASAGVALCLVRRANRDGHAMRTYEAAAMKVCMLVERTRDHLDLFGPEGEAVCYFESVEEMTAKTAWLLSRPEERKRLAEQVYARVTTGANTYHDRLAAILQESVS